ncbi:MAG: hypothetical protein ACREAB_08975 [Blastocatellia bacterium]
MLRLPETGAAGQYTVSLVDAFDRVLLSRRAVSRDGVKGEIGIQRIDRLFHQHPEMVPIIEGDPDKEAVGFIQDLLIGHGYFRVTTTNKQTKKKFTRIRFGLEDKQRGLFEDKTRDALLDFRRTKMNARGFRAGRRRRGVVGDFAPPAGR